MKKSLAAHSAPVAIVTGAARGIGAAIARELAERRISVALLDIDPKTTKQTAALLDAPGVKVLAVRCDVSKDDAVRRAVAVVRRQLGEPSILVNNAGIGGPFHRIDEVSNREWDQIMSTNLRSVFLFARSLLPGMKARGFGRIVNIASVHGLFGAARSSTYVASKHAMIGYTRAIAAEWGAFGITCNAVCPGYVETAMGAQDDKIQDHRRRVLERTPVGRIAMPDEVAALVGQLTDRRTAYVNGAVIVIDGGLTAHLGLS
jgi:3-oxoacyl-[acyl-carrier protein] reductase